MADVVNMDEFKKAQLLKDRRDNPAPVENEPEQEFPQPQPEEPEEQAPKAMSTSLFLILIFFAAIILFIEWLSLGVFGFLVAIPINVLSWFLSRPYNKSLKQGKWILSTSLVLDSLPFLGAIPIDMLGLIYVYLKSHSALAQHVANLTEKLERRQRENLSRAA